MKGFDTPLALVGNSLAVQVAATERAKRGLPTLVINQGGPLGGYFAGVTTGGALWDAGMVVCEFTSFRTPVNPPAIASYDPMRRNDAGRFTHAVEAYFDEYLPTRTIRAFKMSLGGQWLPDLILGNALAALPLLGCRHAVRDEVLSNLAMSMASPWHAQRKDAWQNVSVPDYDTVSRINHGSILHDTVFAPFARKVLGRDASNIHALFHRILWLPLYWPQTLLAALDEAPTNLPATVYSHPVGAPVARLCAELTIKMANFSKLTVRNERLLAVERSEQGFVLHLAQSGRIHAARLAWSQSPFQGLQACGSNSGARVEPRLPLLLVFLKVARSAIRRDFSVLHVLSSDTGIYRVVNTTDCAGTYDNDSIQIVVEANPKVFVDHHGSASCNRATIPAVIEDLYHIGILLEGCIPLFSHELHLPGALPLPTPESLRAWGLERDTLLEKLPGLELLGNSSGPFATSISDQIVQGLQLAERVDL
jgi:hypothetical protein